MMEDTPTTMNGPLASPGTTLDDRRIVATFDTAAQAAEARDALVQAGIAAARIEVADHAAADPVAQAHLAPPDDSLIGRVRTAILPDDDARTTREAVREGQAILTVTPLREEVESVVQLLEAAHPRHFDARLERWRNSG